MRKFVAHLAFTLILALGPIGAHAATYYDPGNGEPNEPVLRVVDDLVEIYPDGYVWSVRQNRWINNPEEIQPLLGPGAVLIIGVGGGAIGGGISAYVTGGNAQQIFWGTVYGGIAGGYFTIATLGGWGLAVSGTVLGVSYTAGGALIVEHLKTNSK